MKQEIILASTFRSWTKNEDAIATTGVAAENVDAGHAVIPSEWWQLDCQYDDIASITVKSYEFLTNNGDGTYGNSVSYKLNKPITLVFSGKTSENDWSDTASCILGGLQNNKIHVIAKQFERVPKPAHFLSM